MSADYPGITPEAWRHHPAIVDTFYGGVLPEVPKVEHPDGKPRWDKSMLNVPGWTAPTAIVEAIAEMTRRIDAKIAEWRQAPAPEGFYWDAEIVPAEYDFGYPSSSAVLTLKPVLRPLPL